MKFSGLALLHLPHGDLILVVKEIAETVETAGIVGTIAVVLLVAEAYLHRVEAVATILPVSKTSAVIETMIDAIVTVLGALMVTAR